MNVTLTGATGLIGTGIVRALQARGDAVTVLSRDPDKARAALRRRRGARLAPRRRARARRRAERARRGRAPRRRERGPALDRRGAARDPRVARDGHAQPRRGPRCRRAAPARARQRLGRRLLRPARRRAGHRGRRRGRRLPGAGVRGLGARGRRAPREHGARVAMLRTGVVLDQGGGALAKMLPFFRLGLGGPVAGGRQYLPWIHAEDIVGLYLAALDGDAWEGPINATAPDARHQPRLLPCAGPRAAPPRLRPRPGPRGAPALRRHGRDRHRRASARCRRARSSTATPSGTPTSTKRCATRSDRRFRVAP